ncbi:hypothetical protein ACWD74_40625, partial [Streptomyces fagopyri]
ILRFARRDNPTSGTATRKHCDWQPQEHDLLAGLDRDHCFAWLSRPAGRPVTGRPSGRQSRRGAPGTPPSGTPAATPWLS